MPEKIHITKGIGRLTTFCGKTERTHPYLPQCNIHIFLNKKTMDNLCKDCCNTIQFQMALLANIKI